jgi:hypothetical protein
MNIYSADHSVTHNLPSANTFNELEGMRRWAANFAGLNRGKIQGVRFPFLNYSSESIELLSKMGFLYDSSLANFASENFWPYTMDNGVATDCLGILSLCESTTKKATKAKGVWEIPMSKIQGRNILLKVSLYVQAF